MRTRVALLALVALLVAGCAATSDDGDDSDSIAVGTAPATSPSSELPGRPSEGFAPAVEGTLDGSAELEGGCVWIGVDGQTFELTPAAGADFTIDTDRIAVVGPDGSVVARAGDRVRVEGSVAEDMMSFCQVGPIFQATSVSPA